MRVHLGEGVFGSGGGILAALIPKGVCPLCMAATGSLLSSIGIPLGPAQLAWLVPSALLLSMAMAGVAALARRRRNQPALLRFAMSAVACLTVYVGWFARVSAGVYAGMAMLFTMAAIDIVAAAKRRGHEHCCTSRRTNEASI